MKTTINERFTQMIAALGFTRNAFARKIGVASAQVYNIIGSRNAPGGRNAPSFDMLSKIAITFPGVNMKWLITGEGQVLLPEAGQNDGGIDMMGKIKILEDKINEISSRVGEKKSLKKLRA